jgi:hypothetical protein
LALLYGLSVFLSAFLLFQVEPLIAKIILPWFGGSAAVWTTCLVFFQVVLLVGNLYVYWLIRCLRPKLQTWIHVSLLATSLLLLPILPDSAWKPYGSEDPTLRMLGLLAVTVGLPYFLLSATSPLLQTWYAQTRRDVLPYRLFALSNAGSLLALLTYPVVIEPVFSARHQAIGWSLAYASVSILCAPVALSRVGVLPTLEPAGPRSAPTWKDHLLWMSLAACASVLLLAVTNHLSQDVSAVPLLWVLPLSLYLLSFVLCFGKKEWYRRTPWLLLLAVALGGMSYALSPEYASASLALLILLYGAGLFVCCMVCHGELARAKPHPAYLTSFYLMASLGGALGGMFVGLLAPRLFRGYFELPTGLASCAILILTVLRHDPSSRFYRARWRPSWLALVGLTVILVIALAKQAREETLQARGMVRNFYGVLRVIDLGRLLRPHVGSAIVIVERARRKLMDGPITHGTQFLAINLRRQSTTYYGPRSGVGLVLRQFGHKGNLRVGVIGLGAGTLASYGRRGDHYTFYEINPLVIHLAETAFTFLKDSEAKVDIIPGDARLSLDREPAQGFDVLALDAFSGDSIPVHLLTREAFVLYFRHLKSDGIVAVHVSNMYLDLQPVVQRAAESLGKEAIVVHNDQDADNDILPATWVLVSDRRQVFDEGEVKRAGSLLEQRSDVRVWTDDYSNLFQVLR